MALASLVRDRKAEKNSLVGLISDALKESRDKTPMAEEDWVRVSSIGSMCPREEVLCSNNNIVREDSFDGYVGLNFELGNAVHWLFQNRAIAATGKIIGSWRCTYCGEVYGSRATRMVPRPDRCIRCGAIAEDVPRANGKPDLTASGNAFLYVEEWLGNHEFRIGGSPDGQMVFGDPLNYAEEDLILLEFKSASDNNFAKYRNTPDFLHVIQTQVYLWLTGYKKAKILYFNKNFSPSSKNPIHEHNIEFDPGTIEQVQEAIRLVRGGIDSGVVPERKVCASRDCSRAFRCKVRDLCFAG